MVEIPDIHTAGSHVSKHLDLKPFKVFHGSYGVTAIFMKSQSGKVHVVQLSNAFFRSFSYVFPQCKGQGWGNSINYDLLKLAAEMDAMLITVLKDTGVIYGADAKPVLEFVKENKTVRLPPTEKEEYASYPIRMLTKLYPRDE